MDEDLIIKKLSEIDAKLDRAATRDQLERFEVKVENRFENVETRLEGVDNRLGRVEDRLVDHEDHLVIIQENMVTKDELNSFKEETRDGMDKQLVILQRLDQERVFTSERVKRVEDDVETIKLQLKTV